MRKTLACVRKLRKAREIKQSDGRILRRSRGNDNSAYTKESTTAGRLLFFNWSMHELRDAAML